MEHHKGGHLVCHETDGVLIDLYHESKRRFQETSFYEFCQRFQWHNQQAAWAFSEVFDGHQLVLGGLTIKVFKESIACICLPPAEGNRSFKQKQVKVSDYNQFLMDQHQNP